MTRPINLRGDRDYELPKKVSSVWVGVDGFSVYIHRADEGVVVDVYAKNREMDESIASTWAHINDLPVEEP
jgi:hypothetical protein